MNMSMGERFDIEKVKQAYERSLHEDDDILLDEYLKAYEEINKFFNSLGTVFTFISSDVSSKIGILYALHMMDTTNVTSKGGGSGNGNGNGNGNENINKNFHTIKTMILYEKVNDLFKNAKYVSGSRTLLRLHRGLEIVWNKIMPFIYLIEFLYEFLNGLGNLEDNDRTYTCCKEAYERTLAVHHPWMVRKGALVAMCTLPTRGELLKRVCVNAVTATELLPDMLNYTKIVYDRIQALYTLHDLHSLP